MTSLGTILLLFMHKAIEDKRLMEKYVFHVQSQKNLFSDFTFFRHATSVATAKNKLFANL